MNVKSRWFDLIPFLSFLGRYAVEIEGVAYDGLFVGIVVNGECCADEYSAAGAHGGPEAGLGLGLHALGLGYVSVDMD